MKKKFMIAATMGLFLSASMFVGCKKKANASGKTQPSTPPVQTVHKSGALGSGQAAGVRDPKKLYKIVANAMTLKKGATGNASFDIRLVKGSKVHPKAPFQCTLSSSAGLSLSKKTLGHKDKAITKDKKTKLVSVRVSAGVTAKDSGKQHVKMDCAFFVCTKDICMRTTEKITVAGNVK